MTELMSTSRSTVAPSRRQRRLLRRYAQTGAADRAVCCQVRLTGRLDVDALSRALTALVERHGELRTAVLEGGADPVLRTVEPYAVDLVVERVRKARVEPRAALRDDPFDLADGALLRARLFDLGPREHLLALAVHELAADRRSLAGLLEALAEQYTSSVNDPEGHRPVAAPRHRTRAEPGVGRQVARVSLDLPDVAALGDRAAAVAAACAVVLARDGGTDEPAAGLLGPSGDPVALALDVDERSTFRDLAASARTALAAAARQSTPDASAGVRVVVEEDRPPALAFAGLDAELVELVAEPADREIVLRHRHDGGRLRLDLDYPADAVARAAVERLGDRLRTLLGSVTAEPDVPLVRLALCTPRERARVLDRGDGGPARPGPFVPVHELLAHVAAAHPDRPAVVAERTVTFGALDREAERLAALLSARGIGAESAVALCLPRIHDLVVAVFGVLKAGAAYVPVDPSYPRERIAWLLADCGAPIVLTHSSVAARIPAGTGARPLVLDDPATLGGVTGAGRTPVAVDARHIAYEIYTSGSTGRPKGVQITHGAVANLLRALEHAEIADAPGERVAWNASVSFDASVQQWTRLCRGDTLILLDEQTRADPAALAETVVSERLAAVDITPSHLRLALPHLRAVDPPDGRPLRLLVGGEDIGAPLWKELDELERTGHAGAVNLYGPTECTVDASFGWVRGSGRPNIGRPLPGVRLYVLDAWMRPVPVGMTGDLYIAGGGLARGYRGRPGLTAERFVCDVVAGDGSRMYHTGDRARWRPDGLLEFAGRADRQVKVRGYRIELGEIEAVVGSAPDVLETLVTVRDDLPSGEGIAAYCRTGSPMDAPALRRWCADRLPEFMVPSMFVPTDRFPLTVNGKVDEGRLPPPTRESVTAAPGPDATGDDAPLGPIEELLAAVWSDVLGAQDVTAHDNFFDLGGHSALAIRVVARLRRDGRIGIPMVAVFEHPRLRDLADYIATTQNRT
ncbi:amino acid adenylation domain-containing protein [Dactylosporangium roseum]|uniref:Amino acid adenylation domain-containing protein n=1 Tax=Dactylosporangium roseum TaxID=47989 RepID=A0ABY5ZDU2_9ACTN|nr:amino acid adenylation domain-containing protein [Dactylosporangium roseum]UWZ39118.1 amino acid adenylation domain-containing protein [Dactylosporangium roseum]